MATGQVGYDSFPVAALAEQGPRVAAAATAKRTAEAEACARMAGLREESNRAMEQLRQKANRAKERAEVDRIARERDPRYIAKVEQRIEKVLGFTGKAAICPYPEVAMDVDKPHHLDVVRAAWERRQRQERAG